MIIGITNFKNEKYLFKFDSINFSVTLEDIEYREKTFEDLKELFEAEYHITVLDGRTTDGNDIVFNLTNNGMQVTSPGIYSANVYSYIIFNGEKKEYNGLGIQARELDFFFDKNKALNYNVSSLDDGTMEMRVKPFKETQESFNFSLNDDEFLGSLNVSRKIIDRTIILNSELHINKVNLDNIVTELEEVVSVFSKFFRFVSNRLNVQISKVNLKSKSQDNKFRIIGEYFRKDQWSYDEMIEKDLNKIISFDLLEGSLPNLIHKISKGELYLRHLPITYKEGKNITPARFIMSSAAFEWQYKHTNDIEPESEIKQEVISYLEEVSEQKTGKDKKYIKGLLKIVKSKDNSLNQRMQKALNEHDVILTPFIKHLYSFSNIKNYSNQDISSRLAEERNNFAHGNLDKEFKGDSVYDLLLLEWLYYVIVLKEIGLSDKKIQKSINKLFHRLLDI
ncbi:HEPN domain-containing protein [Shouchella miscanthi]|uniref:HEPN domain-containing protein n=1 Tax=Shouchella miscanthi TaxID=2598861 RepID=UPI00119E820F|nr:HEPN domain-containing protein [Shouchella miscanthi]